MAKRINIDLNKAVKETERFLSQASQEIMANKDKILAIVSITAIVDSIKTHFEKAAVEKAYEKDSIKYKSIASKHEAEIQVLKEQADRSIQAEQRVQQLEQVVQEILEERTVDE